MGDEDDAGMLIVGRPRVGVEITLSFGGIETVESIRCCCCCCCCYWWLCWSSIGLPWLGVPKFVRASIILVFASLYLVEFQKCNCKQCSPLCGSGASIIVYIDVFIY